MTMTNSLLLEYFRVCSWSLCELGSCNRNRRYAYERGFVPIGIRTDYRGRPQLRWRGKVKEDLREKGWRREEADLWSGIGKEDERGRGEEDGILNLGGKAPSFLNLKKVAPIHRPYCPHHTRVRYFGDMYFSPGYLSVRIPEIHLRCLTC